MKQSIHISIRDLSIANSKSKQETETYFCYTLASRWDRLFASIIETIALSIPLILILGTRFLNYEDPVNFTIFICSIMTSTVLGGFFYMLWSGNIGHKIMGLKVISSIDGSDQKQFSKGALRECAKSIFGIFIIPLIWMIWDEHAQNLYDKIENTYVVKKTKNKY